MKENYIFVYIGTDEIPILPPEYCLTDFKFVQTDTPDELISNPDSGIPSVILMEFNNKKYDGPETVLKIKIRWKNTTVFALLKDFTCENIKRAYDAGISDVLQKPLNPETFYSLLLKSYNLISTENNIKMLLEFMIDTDTKLLEKSTILQTILDILSHDSKNIFINLRTLISQLDKNPVRNMLTDCVDELYNNLMESIGYLESNKRVISIVDLLDEIRITQERIPVTSHSRIKINHESRYLLFVETTRLLKNAVMNIIENALKYSADDQDITISVGREGGNILIHIADRGRGIPDNEKQAVFKRNYRREQTIQIEGTGKGLWITSNIIKNEGGKLAVSDNPGGGAVFTIELPVFEIGKLDDFLNKLSEWYSIPLEKIRNKADAVETLLKLQNFKNTKITDSLIGANLLDKLRKERKELEQKYFITKLNSLKNKNKDKDKKVLIIDDSVYVQYYLASHFTDIGYGIADFSTNGIDGVFMYKKHMPDIVTCDITMPVLSGIETAKRIYKINKDARIIFITALGSSAKFITNLKKAIPERKYYILTKPIKKEHLKNILVKINSE